GTGSAQFRGELVRKDLPLHRVEAGLRGGTRGAVGGVPQGAPVPDLLQLPSGAARAGGDDGAAARAPSGIARVLPAQARCLPCPAGRIAPATAGGRRELLPARRLFPDQRPGRRRLLPLADPRAWRGGHSVVAFLRRATARTA